MNANEEFVVAVFVCGSGDVNIGDVETLKINGYDSVASYCLDVKILMDTQDIYNESFSLLYEYDDV